MMSVNAANGMMNIDQGWHDGAHSEDNADHYQRLIHFLCCLDDSLQFAMARLPGNSHDLYCCSNGQRLLMMMGPMANRMWNMNHLSIEMVEGVGSSFFLYSYFVARL